MKKIALCRSYLGDSRIEKIARFLGGDFEVSILYWSRDGRTQAFDPADKNIQRNYFHCKAPYYSLRLLPWLLVWSIWLFWKLVRSDAEIYHATDLDTAYPAFFASKIRKRKFVYDIADVYRDILPAHFPSWLKRLTWFLERIAINSADLVILPDERRKEQIAGSSPRKLLFIYNVPDIPENLPNIRKVEDFTKGKFSIAYFGSLNNQRYILEMANIAIRDDHYRMVIGGV